MTVDQYNANLSEHHLQALCVLWFRNKHRNIGHLLFAIPNGARLGGKDRIARAKNWYRLEREGAVKGAADLFLAVPSGDLSGLFIEMKTPRGKQSQSQMEFERSVLKQGYGYAMPRSTKEFEAVIGRYLTAGEY